MGRLDYPGLSAKTNRFFRILDLKKNKKINPVNLVHPVVNFWGLGWALSKKTKFKGVWWVSAPSVSLRLVF